MTDLIDALEAAEGPSRELDARIWKLVDPQAHESCRQSALKICRRRYWDVALVDGIVEENADAYSESLDAALSLVPEGHSLAGLWEAVNPKDRPWWGCDVRRDDPYGCISVHGSATPALALAIAALRAMEADDG